MKELFVSYSTALILKEKGFDEPCFGIYDDKGNWSVVRFDGKTHTVNNSYYFHLKRQSPDHLELDKICAAPLYQQVIDFLDKKGIHINITPEFYKNGINWNFQVWEYDPNGYKCTSDRSTGMYGDNGEYPTRLEAIIGAIEKALKLI
jgi:hypothetical protein